MLGSSPFCAPKSAMVGLYIILFLIGGGPALSSPPSKGPSYESLERMAASACPRASKSFKRAILGELVEIEKTIPIPSSARGIILAAACMESGYRVRPRCGDKGKSCGMFQVRTWLSKRYAVDRYDYKGVARALLTHILRSTGKAKRKCGRLGKVRLFWIAYSWITRGPQGWTCYGASKHRRLLRRWRWRLKRKGS